MTPSRCRLVVNWILIAAALVALIGVLVTEKAWTTGELTARSKHLVVGFRAQDVQRLVVSESGKRVVVERANEVDRVATNDLPHAVGGNSPAPDARWLVREPFQGEAEEAAADALLRAIEFATVVRQVPTDGFDRVAAGLDDPVRVIELHVGEVRTRLRFGAQAPTPAGARYVEVAGEGTANKGVYVVSKATADELHVKPDEFRIRQLVPYAASKLRSVTLESPGYDPVVLVNTAGLWTVMVNGTPVRLDPSVWERLFIAFARSHADVILESSHVQPDSELRAEQVLATLTPLAEDQAVARLRFGGVCPRENALELAVRLAPEPLAVCIKPLFLRSFMTASKAFADLSLFSFQRDEVEEWSVTQGDSVLELARRANGWQMRQPETGTVERQVGDARLESLLELKGELVGERPPATELVSTVQIRTGGESDQEVREQRIEVYTRRTANAAEQRASTVAVYIRRLQDGAWLRVEPSALRLLTPDALLLKETQVIELDAKQLRAFTLRTPDWTQSVDVGQGGEVCRFEVPVGVAIDRALCSDVVDALRSVRAQAWISARDTGEFGLDQPVVQAQVQTADQSFELTVGALAVGGGHYARLGSDPAVFTVTRSFVDTITTLMLDRSPFMLRPEQLESLTLTTPERKVVLRRLGQEFIQTMPVATSGRSSDHPRLSKGQIEAVLDALSLLRPEAAVTLSDAKDELRHRRYGFDRPLLEVRPSHGLGWVVGAGDVYRDVSIYYARAIGEGANAVFALPRQAVTRILDALSG